MKYLLLIVLIGVALYYAMKWNSPGKGNSNNSNSNNRKTYGSSGNSNSRNSQRDSGPYKSSGASNNSQKKGGGSNYAKWVGGGLGWAFGGPIGGILGFMMGSMFEGGNSSAASGTRTQYGRTQSGDFSISLLILTAAVMKADGSVKRSELDYVKRFLENNFGNSKTPQYVKMLGELLKQELNVQEVSSQIANFMDYESRMMLVQYLFGIAQADGSSHPNEIDMIQTIANFMGISTKDFQSIKAMFVKDTGNAYKVLNVDENATNDEIKKAYRELAKKHHPDRVAHLGEEVKKSAEQKFTILNAAYESVKEERGMN